MVGCSSNSSSSPTPSVTASATGAAFCDQIKQAQDELNSIADDLKSGNPAQQSLAIGKLVSFYNKALAELPANQSAAISQALTDAKSNIGSGGTAANAQEGIDKINAAVKKQCPNL